MKWREFKLYGKHAEYANFLCKEQGRERENGINIFQRVIDLYMLAPLIGLKYGRRVGIPEAKRPTTSIQVDQMYNEKENVEYVYRIVMLLAEKNKYSEKERIARAFRVVPNSYENDPNREEEVKLEEKELSYFQDYVRGGIEYIYEFFKECEPHNDFQIQQRLLMFAATESVDDIHTMENIYDDF
ncbi:hypothetical protein [uncultured Dubosiella sp.]|uniref:hypothetical protein n=1 Tax=uncultured Dubosiella sp. TaxID=1937011 RepID=UPI00261F9674|nr:hypothetical protein [uncultured Dubosiella sp.]